jgi:hypothetical protein
MFVRIKRSGQYEYLQVVHNERLGGRVRPVCRAFGGAQRTAARAGLGGGEGADRSAAGLPAFVGRVGAAEGSRPAAGRAQVRLRRGAGDLPDGAPLGWANRCRRANRPGPRPSRPAV